MRCHSQSDRKGTSSSLASIKIARHFHTLERKMIQARLNDAAIVLYQVLDQAGIKHGIFGGYAIGSLGGPRESKDIDCIASVTKDEIIRLLDGRHGFQFVNQPRPDYVAFVWSDTSDKRNAVLVEIFVERFEGTIALSCLPLCQ